MKIRVVIMTENKKHLDEKHSKELIEQAAKDLWGCFLKAIAIFGEDDDTAFVESCELVQE